MEIMQAPRLASFLSPIADLRAAKAVLPSRRHLPKLCLWTGSGLVLWTLVIVTASFFDGSWTLDGNGIGLLEHYGAWTILLTSPVLLFLGFLILTRLTVAFERLRSSAKDDHLGRRFRLEINSHIRSLWFRKKSRWLVPMFSITGFLFAMINIRQTVLPVETYGNDVFDSYNYFLGFLAFKIYLVALWSIVYPFLGFILIHATVSMIVIMRMSCNYKLLKINLFHEDNCGGMSRFGHINMLIMLSYVCVLGVMLAIIGTHASNSYATINMSLIGFSFLAITQSVAGVYFIRRVIAVKKQEQLEVINDLLDRHLDRIDEKPPSSNLLQIRNHIIQVHSFPYTKQVGLVVNTLRIVPLLIALNNVIKMI